jgi:hypothetical protein
VETVPGPFHPAPRSRHEANSSSQVREIMPLRESARARQIVSKGVPGGVSRPSTGGRSTWNVPGDWRI